jgi:adenylate cyclase
LSAPEAFGVAIAAAVVALVAVPLFWLAYLIPRAIIPYGAVLLATVIPATFESYSRLTRDRRAIREQFGVYVSPAVLDELSRRPDLVRQGVRREVTLLFSDIRGSTTLSEHIAPELWLQQLNEYLTQMSAAVFEHDGYLDKFMGDGIMAVWNTFGRQEDHAAAAVAAGLRMLSRLEALNAAWQQMPDRTPLRIGIGVHTGEAIVGNVGSHERTQFTVIGDAVNTAARIEALTKEHGVAFIITEATADRTRGLCRLREIGASEVRGRTGKVRVFEVLGAAGPPREGEG